ncbi:unnamed protein product, partial [Didymodactylos carnosus]
TEDVESLFKLRYFITDLCKQLKQIYDENLEFYHVFETTSVYRGLRLSDQDIEQLKQSRGKYISTNGFLSTSLKQEVAELFATNVMFEIKVDMLQTFAYIAQLSKVPDEEEVLFDLGAVFKIENVAFDGKKWVVSMIGDNTLELLNNDYITNLRKFYLPENDGFANNYPDIVYGYFLLTMGHESRGIDYFENLFKLTSPSTDYIKSLWIIYMLINAYTKNQQIDLLEKYETIACDVCMLLKTIAPSANEIYLQTLASRNYRKQQYDLALDYYITELKNPISLSKIQKFHHLIGLNYFNQENYFYSYKHQKQSLEILVEFYPNDNSISNRLMNMGRSLLYLDNYTESIKYFKKSYEIKKKCLPLQHPDYKQLYFLFSVTYYLNKQFDLCIQSCQMGLQIIDRSYDYEFYYFLAKSYFERKQYNLAIDYYFDLFKIEQNKIPKNEEKSDELVYLIEKCYKNKEEEDKLEINDYLKLLELYENYHFDRNIDATVYRYEALALLYENGKNYDEAMKYWSKLSTMNNIIEISNNNSKFCFHLGLCHFKMNQYDLAIDFFNKSQVRLPDSLALAFVIRFTRWHKETP